MTDCACTPPRPDGTGKCSRCRRFACEYAGPGLTRCTSATCTCHEETP